MSSGKKRDRKLKSDRRMICLVCGNSTWREVDIIEEEKYDHHFYITDSTHDMLKEAIAKFGTMDAGLRAILEDYRMFESWKQQKLIRELAQVNTIMPDAKMLGQYPVMVDEMRNYKDNDEQDG